MKGEEPSVARGGGRGEGEGIVHDYTLDPSVSLRSTAPRTSGSLI